MCCNMLTRPLDDLDDLDDLERAILVEGSTRRMLRIIERIVDARLCSGQANPAVLVGRR